MILILFIVFPALPLLAAEGAATLYSEGNARFERGDYQGAAERYQDLIRRHPGSDNYPDALYRLGIARIKTGQAADGVALLKRLEARYPTGRYRSGFWIGYGYQLLGIQESALSAWEGYLVRSDSLYRAETLVGLAFIYFSRSEFPRAEELLLELEGLNLSFFVEHGGLELLAEIYSGRDAYQELIGLAEELSASVRRPPARFLLNLGEAYQKRGNQAQAERSFRRILETGKSEELAAAYGRLFALFEAESRLSEMEELILDAEDRLAADRTALAGFWFRVGAVLAAGERPARGIGYLKRAWDVRDRIQLPATLPLFYAQALTSSGDPDGAAEILEMALEEKFGDPDRLTYRLALVYGRLERWEEVIALYDDSPAGMRPAVSVLLARAFLETGQYTAGIETVSSALDGALSPAEQAELLDLSWRLQAALGAWDGAVKSYSQRQRLTGETVDSSAQQYATLLFNARLYDQVVRRLPAPHSSPVASLLRGLAYVGLEEYSAAREALSALDEAGLSPELRAIRSYYLAWSLYRLGDYGAALPAFSRFRAGFPEHSLAPEAAFYAGWSAFTLNQYMRAAEEFAAYGPRGPRAEDALLARARALAAAGRDGEAILLSERLGNDGSAKRADEALYLIFDIRLRAGDLDGSERTLQQLISRFPGSSWTPRALYRQGRKELEAGRLSAAGDSLDRYRRSYPTGEYVPDALYYRAEAALKGGETRLALLLWQRLSQEFPGSPLSPRALAERGRELAGLGDFREALQVYRLLLSEYPTESRRLGAGEEVARLEKLLVSAGSEYKRLLTVSQNAGGIATREGREAMMSAVQSALAEGRAADFSAAGAQIRQLLEARPEDDREKATILRLAAEYAFRRNEYGEAASRYLAAAAAMPGNPDFTAEALYRAAQMSLYAGDPRGYRAVLDRLKRSFPDSPWLNEAVMLEDAPGGSR